EVAIALVGDLDVHVAEDRMLHPRLDAIDQVVWTDVADDLVRKTRRRLLRRAPGQRLVGDVTELLRPQRRVVGGGTAEETPRRHPDRVLLRPRTVGSDRLIVRTRLRWWTTFDRRRNGFADRVRGGVREVDRAAGVWDLRCCTPETRW